MQKKAEHAEASSRAKLQAKKQPQVGAAVDKASVGTDISGNATDKENKSNAANLPSNQQPQAPPSLQQLLPSRGIVPRIRSAAALEHASIISSGAQEVACNNPAPAAALGSRPLPAPVEQSDTGLVAKRRRVQPSWLRDCQEDF